MNFFGQIQIIYLPWWIKFLVALIIVGATLICGLLFYQALVDGDKPAWIEAGAYLLGIIFPVLLIVIVLGGATFGEQSILRRTEDILCVTIPYHLQFIPEESPEFIDFRRYRRSGRPKEEDLARVELFHTKGRCYADYIVTVPHHRPDPEKVSESPQTLRLFLRVEFNVKRVNVNIAFRIADLHRLIEPSDHGNDRNELAAIKEFLRGQFPHTLAVEDLHTREAEGVPGESSATIAYRFNPEFLVRRIEGKKYLVVVASTRVPDDTVVNASEKVFFAQDLMFMVRAFMQENPRIFAVVAG